MVAERPHTRGDLSWHHKRLSFTKTARQPKPANKYSRPADIIAPSRPDSTRRWDSWIRCVPRSYYWSAAQLLLNFPRSRVGNRLSLLQLSIRSTRPSIL